MVLKKKYQICFLELKKLGFLVKEKSYLSYDNKENQICILKKYQICFYMCKEKKEKDFLRRWLYSWNKSMLHALNETNTTIHDPFFISKSTVLKNQIYI